MYYGTNKRYIGMAVTSKFEDPILYYLRPFRRVVLRDAKGYESVQEAYKAGHEVVIDTKESKVSFKIDRNATLVEER